MVLFSTSVFQKPTFTGLYTNYNSFIPFKYKKGLVTTVLYHYFSNCCCFASFTSQLVSFKKTFLLNSYPISFVDCIQSFLNKIHSPIPKVSLAPKKILYFRLPFTGQHSLQIHTQIKSVQFFVHLRLAEFLPFEDQIPKSLKSCVVLSVNSVVHCISAKPAVFFRHVFQTTWKSRPLLGKSALTLPSQVFCYTKGTWDTWFLHMTLMFYPPVLIALTLL